jgi:hypothetical protein
MRVGGASEQDGVGGYYTGQRMITRHRECAERYYGFLLGSFGV